ncbi:MAG TPA: hypothetical protein VD930_01180, partial [Gemmatimonadales bacterium]|nr:hypothetical protein [Gemmatimonadales bacterium]
MKRINVRILMAAASGALTAACHDQVRPGSEGGSSPVVVTYRCGNEFLLQNHDSKTITVQYAVAGTPETGELLLPGDSSETGAITRLITLSHGTLELSQPDAWLIRTNNESTACPPEYTDELAARVGSWTPPLAWPVVAVHLHLLPDGRVLSWGRTGNPQLYQPADGSFTEAPVETQVFCAGHTFLPDGRLLVSGGHLDDKLGLRDANIFGSAGQSWLTVPPMSFARWYPTSTTLPNGEVLTLGGTDEDGDEVLTPEIWDGSSWRGLPGADQALPYYPRTFVAPNGLVFYAGELQQTAYLDPAEQGRWIPVADSRYGRRDYGSAVMYRPGKVMIVGGSDP